MTFAARFDRLDAAQAEIYAAVIANGKVLAAHSVEIANLKQESVNESDGRRHWGGIIVAAVVAVLAAGCTAAITMQMTGG